MKIYEDEDGKWVVSICIDVPWLDYVWDSKYDTQEEAMEAARINMLEGFDFVMSTREDLDE